ncbi:carbamoyl-phosphate synthase L chain, ATP binding domain-domain-containing protein [Catenaria anguillulae PL171]|uniref:Carbamoyl-phosphate synthase L chain, ATP binding domain-domain-containing protein n=1 Tax=Catenaria anguillulae PL171 TaxID=765915 RepID=A0A1Y2HE52_9FUNG|nr:carbamoyl-phosphate synthase L chain, ATP binding domain-domain-containing protein [Catenaria anguillulae PL171]
MTKLSNEQPKARAVGRILIANRGEIAARIIRTCKALGKSTVAVFSDADRSLPYVQQADVAFRLGPAPATDSYLSIDAILRAARATGADAIHPGYGFLSESSEFARAVQNEGLTWIGPNPESIDAIGDKRKAKELLSTEAQEVPLVPGYHGKEQSSTFSRCMLKKLAAAGGGGKACELSNDLKNAAQGEAQRSFGSPQVLLERYFETIKHVEVQIIGDVYGNVVSLGTRECSMQRRHQKVIEEAPAPAHLLKGNGDAALGMEACAVLIGKTVQYVGVGTVEFLVDVSTGRFYFLEVNTRLQVEHTVSEQVTGLDLVQLQVQVAEGRALDDILPEPFLLGTFTPQLHSIQCRLYAEDANNNFTPSTGTIVAFSPPANDHCRVEAGVESGSTVSVYYDAMVAKLITTAPVRSQAISKMVSAINDCVLLGITTNLAFLKTLLLDQAFADHSHTTNTIERILSNHSLLAIVPSSKCFPRLHTLATKPSRHASSFLVGTLDAHPSSPCACSVTTLFGTFTCLESSNLLNKEGLAASCLFGRAPSATFALWNSYQSAEVRAIMPCRVLRVEVQSGQVVAKGDLLMVVESMKMETRIVAPTAGVVDVHAKAGSLVEANMLMARVKSDK